jgi:hypothetical protein
MKGGAELPLFSARRIGRRAGREIKRRLLPMRINRLTRFAALLGFAYNSPEFGPELA